MDQTLSLQIPNCIGLKVWSLSQAKTEYGKTEYDFYVIT